MANDMSMFEVKPGCINIEDVYLMHQNDGAYVWVVNCRTAYPRILAVQCCGILLGCGEHTYKQNLIDTNPTEINIILNGSWWHTFGEAGKYDVFLCTVKLEHKPELDAFGWSRQ